MQSACAKMQGKERRDNSGTTLANHRKELQKTGKHSFPYIIILLKVNRNVCELLCEFDLFDTEDMKFDKE